jgi:hypothetical protein
MLIQEFWGVAMHQNKIRSAISSLAFAAVTTFATFAGVSSANNCYIIYDRNDQTIYRGLASPIDLSQQIGTQVSSKWAGAALVIVGEAQKCIPFDALASYVGAADSMSAKSAGSKASGKKRAATKKKVRAKATPRA